MVKLFCFFFVVVFFFNFFFFFFLLLLLFVFWGVGAGLKGLLLVFSRFLKAWTI